MDSLDDVLSKLALERDQSAIALCSAVRTLQTCGQPELRKLCKPWGVQPTERKASGKYGYRTDTALINELTMVFVNKARKFCSTNKSESIATEHATHVTKKATAEFSLKGAMAEALQHIKAIRGNATILVRIVDHACHSQECVSHHVAAMCQQAAWNTSKDLCNDQPLDACGYIAADAVCRLREAALAEANDWHRMKLPNYAQEECIDRGNKVLGRRDLDRILDSDQVNRLVRNYSHLDKRKQTAEEWWAGAVALDHFLKGLPDIVEELATDTSGQRHRWKAWVVNTQTSAQLGSHWFYSKTNSSADYVSDKELRRVLKISMSFHGLRCVLPIPFDGRH